MINDLMSSAEELRNIYKVGLNTTRLLMALGDVVCAWLLLRQAEVALDKLAGDVSAKDEAFYEGKVAAAQFFAQTNLPRLTAERAIAEATTLDLMDLDEASSEVRAPRWSRCEELQRRASKPASRAQVSRLAALAPQPAVVVAR
jgi:hypothetical protein